MNEKRKIWILAILGLIGLVLTVILTSHFYDIRNGTAAFKSFCNVNSSINCDNVTASKYAELGFGLPLAGYAGAWYLSLIIIALSGLNAFWRRESKRAIFLMSLGGLVFSAAYFIIMAALIHSFCLMCLGVDVINLVIFGIALTLRPEWIKQHKPDGTKWRVYIIIGISSLLLVQGGFKLIFSEKKFDKELINDALNSVMNTPVVSVGAGKEFPSMGAGPDSPITIVEFTDFQCPFCRIGALTINSLVNQYPGKIRVVLRNFPLDPSCNRGMTQGGHRAACEAAQAVICAEKAGKLQQVYEELFDRQKELAPGVPTKLAMEAGIPEKELKECMNSPETYAKIARDLEEGSTLNIRSTPTFFFNGRKIEGAYPSEVWRKLIDATLR
jgi:protein-disulfide isomerase/uncharacterized membrane protein